MEKYQLKIHTSPTGDLVPIEFNEYFTKIAKRLFIIHQKGNTVRGKHAHKTCSQLIFVTSGKVCFKVYFGQEKMEVQLQTFLEILEIPPLHWVEIETLEDSIINVVADEVYCEEEYIRDWNEYLRYFQ